MCTDCSAVLVAMRYDDRRLSTKSRRLTRCRGLASIAGTGGWCNYRYPIDDMVHLASARGNPWIYFCHVVSISAFLFALGWVLGLFLFILLDF